MNICQSNKRIFQILLFLAAISLSFVCSAKDVIDLRDPQFNASGEGDVTTTGTIDKDSNTLLVESPDTWQVGHGIRIERAGNESFLHSADSGWTLAPDSPIEAEVLHDGAEMTEGSASVHCIFSGNQPTSLEGFPTPVDLCEVNLGAPVSLEFDELRFWIKSTSAVQQGDLQIRLLNADRKYTFELPIPAFSAGWTEIFLGLHRKTANGFFDPGGFAQIISLQCVKNCDGIEVNMDQFSLVSDLINTVQSIENLPDGNSVFQINSPAKRSVVDVVVYHDDTEAVRNWLEQASQERRTHLVAPSGTYYLSRTPGKLLSLHNGLHLECENANTTVFKNTGRSSTGTSTFASASLSPKNIRLENCGFDLNGWNRSDFSDVIRINPDFPLARASNGSHYRAKRSLVHLAG